MKKGNLTRWKSIGECTNLLFFSQLVNELIFDYSIPSNRISTLNSHYLCLDAINAIDGIDNRGVPEGTLKPIMEEMYITLKKDPVFLHENENSPLQFFVKYQGDKYVISSKVADMNYGDLKKTANAIRMCFFKNNSYYEMMKKQIIEIVKENSFARQGELFRLVKSILTELMNQGYSLRYIYEVMNRNFWNPSVDVTSPGDIMRFFEAFDFNKKDYEVIFIVKKYPMDRFVECVDGLELNMTLEPRFDTCLEKQFFGNKHNNNAFLQIKIKGLDPFSVAEIAKSMVTISAALYRLYDHTYRYDINTAPCIIYDERECYKIERTISAVEHKHGMSSRAIAESMKLSRKALHEVASNLAFKDLQAILNAVRFHAHSLDSLSEENQLLDLWSIFEAILNINNKNTSDRIQQVCMYLVPILKWKYFYDLFEQLSSDLKNYCEGKFANIVGEATETRDIVQKVCEFTLLSEKKEERNAFLDSCDDFPLLKERMLYYSSTLSDTDSVYRFLEKHGERVRWQVMRIYRNRNLIIHNGDSMPYLKLLIENLHSYVDDFISYSIHSLSKGLDIDSMCQELFVKECNWNATFQRNKRPLDSSLIQNMLTL